MTNDLVNAHTHLELSDLGHLAPQSTLDFPRWQRRLIQQIRQRTPDVLRAACDQGIAELLAAGTTQVGDISSTGVSVEPLVRSGLSGIVWIELLALGRRTGRARLEAAARQIDAMRSIAANSSIRIGLSPHATYSIHPTMWDEILRKAEREAWPLCIHAAESPAEWDLFTRGHGPLTWIEGLMISEQVPARLRNQSAALLAATKPILKRIGVPYCLSVRKTPIAYLEERGVLATQPLLVHVVQVNDEDIARVQRSGARVVHCPRSNQRLRCGRMPLEKFLAAQVPVLLGTDSRSSSPSLNVREEVEAAIVLHAGYVDPTRIEDLARARL